MKSCVVLLVFCLGGSMAMSIAHGPNKFMGTMPYYPYENEESSVNEDLIEYLPFTSCGQDGWVCSGEKPVEATLDCKEHGQSCEGEISVALCNVVESLQSVTIVNWKSVNISFKCGELERRLDKLTVKNVGHVTLLGVGGPPYPFYGVPYHTPGQDVVQQVNRRYPRHMEISGCKNLSLVAQDNTNKTGMEVLILKDVTIDSMRATLDNLQHVEWISVAFTGKSGKNHFNTRMSPDSDFLIERSNLKTMPFHINSAKMVIRKNKIGDLGGWDTSIVANSSFVLEDNKICKVHHLNIQSNDILIQNNDFKAILAYAFNGIKIANSISDAGCDYDPQEHTLRILNNTFHYVQERAMELPPEGELGEHFDVTYDLNKVECSCRNVNWFKSLSYEGSHSTSGRQIIANENFMNGNNTCLELPCEARNAVYSYRFLCGRQPDGYSICPPAYNPLIPAVPFDGNGSTPTYASS